MQKLICVDSNAVYEVLDKIKKVQFKVAALSVESSNQEVETAFHEHSIAQGYINCMTNLNLFEGIEYSNIFQTQLINAERIKIFKSKSSKRAATR